MTDPPRHNAGFTLIEVLVALAITALAFGLAIPAISESLGRTAAIARQDAATTLAETLMVRVGRDIPLIDGNMAGQDGGLDWTLAITPWANEGDAVQHAGVTLHRVVVTVTWPGISRTQTQRLVSLRLNPGW
jgi:general secretion pathway protein I